MASKINYELYLINLFALYLATIATWYFRAMPFDLKSISIFFAMQTLLGIGIGAIIHIARKAM